MKWCALANTPTVLTKDTCLYYFGDRFLRYHHLFNAIFDCIIKLMGKCGVKLFSFDCPIDLIVSTTCAELKDPLPIGWNIRYFFPPFRVLRL
jgi:hypothetical protein